MADRLKGVLCFVGVAPNATATLAHGLGVYGQPLRPDEVKFRTMGVFTLVGASTLDLTIQNLGQSAADCDLLVEAWHPIERQFGQTPNDGSLGQHLAPQPFSPQPLEGGVSPDFFTIQNNAGVAIVPGIPVTAMGGRGNASTLPSARVVGIALRATAPTLNIPVQSAGLVMLTAAQWDLVTGGVGGLIPGSAYVLGTSAGSLSTSAPALAGQCVVTLGTARDATSLILEISTPVLL